MKKFVSLLIVFMMCISLCACGNADPAIETDKTETTLNSDEKLSSESSGDTAKKALEAYSAYIAPFSGESYEEYEGITNALVADLDKNGVPEVIFTYYGEHNMYILSYGKTSGLSVISPVLHSSMGAKVYFSEDDAILYYTDSGHNQGTSWYHEGVCLKATDEGFETIGTVSGDTWDDVPDNIFEDEDLFVKTDSKYDKAFEDSINKLIGDGKYSEFFEECESENAEKYLEDKLNADFASKKAEFSEFRETAISAIGTEPVSVNVGDYDRNGTYEAFVLTGEQVAEEVQGDFYDGTVWFVSDEGKADSLGHYDCRTDGEILECQYNSYYQINLVAGSSSPSAVWTVSGHECEEITEFNDNGSDYFKLASVNAHSNSLVASLNAFDAMLEDLDSDFGTGHTYKPYFYYDTPDGIKEYGGIEISKSQLEALGGGDYIKLIENEGYTVKNIYARENGVISVNFYKHDGEGFYDCNYINLRVTDNGIASLDGELFAHGLPSGLDEIIGEGFYVAASVPDLATYPDKNDYPEAPEAPSTEAKPENNNDFISAYKEILYDIGKNPQKYYEGGNTEDNSFAVADITGDGVPELLVRFEGTYMAAMKMTVWTCENGKADILTECGVYDTFYKGGFIKSDDYHNHTQGETIWPFMIDKCDFESGKIETVHQIYCRDEGYMDREDDPFPHADDKDGDGVIYYICDADGEYAYTEGKPSTKAEYENIVNKYIPEKNKIDADYMNLTKENIEKVK